MGRQLVVTFVCDDGAVEKPLRELVDGIVGLGGRISADAEIVCQDGDLSIRSQAADKPADELILVPEAALIPAAQASFALRGDDIIVESVDEDMDEVRRNLLALMIEIYNLTHKIAGFRAASPQLRLGRSPQILAHLLAGRNSPEKKNQSPGTGRDNNVVKLFLKSRTLGYRFGDTRERTPVLMPVIDSLNHHHRGAQFARNKAAGNKGLAVMTSRPVPGSTECFACYGLYDALDAYLNYAYVELDTPFVRSVPCVLEVPGLGRITVQSWASVKYTGPLAKEIKDLRALMPVVTAEAPDHARVSHLIIPGPTRKLAMRRILAEVMKLLDPSQTNSLLMRRIAMAERDLLARNIAYYRELSRMTDALGDSAEGNTLRQLATIQLARIQAYIDAINEPAGR